MRNILFCCFLALGSSCSDMDSPPELINKLRPVLTTINSQNGNDSAPPLLGNSVSLYFHFLAPEGVENVTIELNATPSGLPNELGQADLISIKSATLIPLSALNHIIVESIWQLPSDSDSIEGITAGVAPFHYSVKAIAEDFEKEINGSFLAYTTADIPAYSWNFADADIELPAGEQAESLSKDSVSIKGKSGNDQNEPVKIAWFTSAGEILNRRAVETTWKPNKEGAQSIIFTVRGKSSKMAAIRSVSVNL